MKEANLCDMSDVIGLLDSLIREANLAVQMACDGSEATFKADLATLFSV